ncbi:MAG: regulatory protein RecX [Dethiobacteria bacterium]
MPDEAALKKARSRLLRLLSYRGRSRREAEEYLQRKGFDSAVISAVLAEMEQWRYIDDRRFTEEFIANCQRRGWGPLRARFALLSKGISRETVEEGIALYYSPEKERTLAHKVFSKRNPYGADEPDRGWIHRQAAFLQRRGFHDQVIRQVLQEHGHFWAVD